MVRRWASRLFGSPRRVLVTLGYLAMCGLIGAAMDSVLPYSAQSGPVNSFIHWAVFGLIMSPLVHPASPGMVESRQRSAQARREARQERTDAATGDRDSPGADER